MDKSVKERMKPQKIKKNKFGLQKFSKSYVFKELAKWAYIIFRTFLFIGLAYVILYPLLTALSKAFSEDYMASATVEWIPKNFGMTNMKIAWSTYLNMPESMFLSIRLSLVAAILQVITSAVVGYGFARYKFKGRELLFSLVILSIIVPPQTYLIPMYIIYRRFHWFGLSYLIQLFAPNFESNLLNTEWSMWLPAMLGVGLRGGLFIYIFRQFFRGMPKDLEEAAWIDGCGPFSTFVRIMVPNALSAALTVFLFSLVWHWNDYTVAGMMFPTADVRPISVMLITQSAKAANGSLYTSLSADINNSFILNAAVLIVITPVLVLFGFLQKYFIESVDRVGIKG